MCPLLSPRDLVLIVIPQKHTGGIVPAQLNMTFRRAAAGFDHGSPHPATAKPRKGQMTRMMELFLATGCSGPSVFELT